MYIHYLNIIKKTKFDVKINALYTCKNKILDPQSICGEYLQEKEIVNI